MNECSQMFLLLGWSMQSTFHNFVPREILHYNNSLLLLAAQWGGHSSQLGKAARNVQTCTRRWLTKAPKPKHI